MPRIRRVEDKKEMEKVIDDFITQGYKVKSQGETTAMMKEKDYGSGASHLIILILLGWWSLGIANALWAAYKYFTAAEVKVQVEDDT